MRTAVAVAMALATGACARVVPFTPDLRAGLTESTGLAELDLRVLGSFQLRGGYNTTIVVRPETRGFDARVVSDTAIMLRVSAAVLGAARDTLDLTFALSSRARGVYTLRAINGTPIGRSIPIDKLGFQYVPCYQNVGPKCLDPIAAGTQEDAQVRIGVKR